MRRSAAAICAALVLSGCGTSTWTAPGISSAVPPAGSKTQSVAVSVVIGGHAGKPSAAIRARRPRFISPSTNGIDIKVYAHGGNTVIGEAITDISSGSAACGGTTGLPRTCTVQVPSPPGADDFKATTYDAAPVGNSFSAAHALGVGALSNVTITQGASNPLVLYISGLVASLGYLAANASMPADGTTHTFGFVLNPADFDDNPITAGTNDPYANPIGIALVESGGSGHSILIKNGTASGTSATLTHSTDTIAVQYDGGGATGYSAAITVSATSVSPATLTVSPMYVTSSSPYVSGKTVTFTATGQTANVAISETGASNTLTYTVTPSTGCSAVNASAPSGTPANTSVTLTASSSGSCSFAFSDGILPGTSSITWNASVSSTSGTVTIPGSTVGPIAFNAYSNGPVRGQNGWLSNSCGGNDYDANVVNSSSYPSAQWPGTPPTKALQVDNAVTQGCFSGLGSPPSSNSAGYPNALADTSVTPATVCGPTCQPFFSVQFVVTSATGGFQPALEMSLNPVWNNQGARMQYVGLWHTLDSGNNQKLLVFTNDVDGVTGGTAPCFQCANFTPWEIAYVDPTLPHTIGMTMQFVQPDNDVVKFYVDGVLSGVQQQSFRSWEDYYLFDTESDPGYTQPYSRAVNDVLFHPANVDTCLNFADYAGNCNERTTGPSHTSTAGNGFLFTNFTTCAGTQSACAGAITTSTMRATPHRGSTSIVRRGIANVHSALKVR